jgi:hypothetical protein
MNRQECLFPLKMKSEEQEDGRKDRKNFAEVEEARV